MYDWNWTLIEMDPIANTFTNKSSGIVYDGKINVDYIAPKYSTFRVDFDTKIIDPTKKYIVAIKENGIRIFVGQLGAIQRDYKKTIVLLKVLPILTLYPIWINWKKTQLDTKKSERKTWLDYLGETVVSWKFNEEDNLVFSRLNKTHQIVKDNSLKVDEVYGRDVKISDTLIELTNFNAVINDKKLEITFALDRNFVLTKKITKSIIEKVENKDHLMLVPIAFTFEGKTYNSAVSAYELKMNENILYIKIGAGRHDLISILQNRI